ncbi:hypothetical protein [Asticcacaulis machinosus]|uniref:SPW repeat-containing protein n=1 Tax=Asticcacaulis machinosus TaxID=2984211 RepID=A0ABT5HGT3_9CAUL|nr:hypothetical protein [Asticcacaulis machinosus]MDC7674814.1 hypothetical protein [Asticcacaulis machinosus]
MGRFKSVRSAVKFFAVSLSAAYLFTIGMKLTGWFTRSPDIPDEGMATTGMSIIVGVAILIFGAAVRRFTAAETQAALLGASAVLLATPVVQLVTTHSFDLSTLVVSGFGIITLVAGLLVALTRRPTLDE